MGVHDVGKGFAQKLNTHFTIHSFARFDWIFASFGTDLFKREINFRTHSFRLMCRFAAECCWNFN